MLMFPAQLDAAYRAAGGLDPHHVKAILGSLTAGLPLDQLEALHAAALGRMLVPDAWRLPCVPHPAACTPAALRVAHNAIRRASGIRVALTGAAYAVPANCSLVRFTQSATVASQTVTMPPGPADGQVVQFVNYAGAITALTFSPAINGWTAGGTLAANTGLRARWDATAAGWYREG